MRDCTAAGAKTSPFYPVSQIVPAPANPPLNLCNAYPVLHSDGGIITGMPYVTRRNATSFAEGHRRLLRPRAGLHDQLPAQCDLRREIHTEFLRRGRARD